MSLRHVSVVSIPVSDQDTAKRFYADLLGFELVREEPMGPDQRWIQLRPSGAETSITLVTWFPRMPAGSITGLVVETDDVQEDYRTFRERGLKLSELQDAPWGRYATFSDPDGNEWVLQQSAASNDMVDTAART